MHFVLGHPIGLLLLNFNSNPLLNILILFILYLWTNHLWISLLTLITRSTITLSSLQISFSNSVPSYFFCNTPHIILSTSWVSLLCLSAKVHVSTLSIYISLKYLLFVLFCRVWDLFQNIPFRISQNLEVFCTLLLIAPSIFPSKLISILK
jgi:hypothetical protein